MGVSIIKGEFMDTSLARVEEFQDENDIYARSNFMISAKYKSSLYANRLMALSLSKINTASESEEGFLTVKIKGREIKNAFGSKSGDFFRQLDNTARGMTGQTVGYTDADSESFTYIAAVIKAKYEDGEFAITFHNELKPYLQNLSKNYSTFSLKIMMKWQSTQTFRFYELLKSRMYHRKNDYLPDNNLFRLQFDINELKLCLGIVNAELADVRKILNKSKGTPEIWAKAVEASPEKTYSTWYDFKRKVIDKATKEINDNPECGVKIHGVDTLKSGKGGKVYAVVIYAEKLNAAPRKKAVVEAEEIDRDDCIDQIRDLIGNIRTKEAKAIGEASGWNLDRIARNYDYSKTKNVYDIVGFMIKAVKEDWASSEKHSRKKSKGANGFDNFSSRNYDYEELMAEVVKK